MGEDYVSLNRDRKFQTFVYPTGPFPQVDIAPAMRDTMIVSLRHHVARSGWRVKMQQAAQIAVDHIADVGLRFELLCAKLAESLGLSRSMGSYYLRRLREVGFLKHYRKHYMDWDRINALRDLTGNEDIFCAAPAVHELSLCRSEATFKPHPPSRGSQGSMDEKCALTREDSPPERPSP